MYTSIFTLGALALIGAIPANAQAATTYYVDDDCPSQPGDGSASAPFCSIQPGLDMCLDEAACTVLVSPGTYTEAVKIRGDGTTLEADSIEECDDDGGPECEAGEHLTGFASGTAARIEVEGTAIKVLADDVTVAGFDITATSGYPGILATVRENGTVIKRTTVEGNVLRDTVTAIFIADGWVRRNTSTTPGFLGTVTFGSPWGVNVLRLDGNRFMNKRLGACVIGSWWGFDPDAVPDGDTRVHATFTGNDLRFNSYGLQVIGYGGKRPSNWDAASSSYTVVQDNDLSGNALAGLDYFSGGHVPTTAHITLVGDNRLGEQQDGAVSAYFDFTHPQATATEPSEATVFITDPHGEVKSIGFEDYKVDDDGDGRTDEDAYDGKDNDGDGLIDEDRPDRLIYNGQEL